MLDVGPQVVGGGAAQHHRGQRRRARRGAAQRRGDEAEGVAAGLERGQRQAEAHPLEGRQAGGLAVDDAGLQLAGGGTLDVDHLHPQRRGKGGAGGAVEQQVEPRLVAAQQRQGGGHGEVGELEGAAEVEGAHVAVRRLADGQPRGLRRLGGQRRQQRRPPRYRHLGLGQAEALSRRLVDQQPQGVVAGRQLQVAGELEAADEHRLADLLEVEDEGLGEETDHLVGGVEGVGVDLHLRRRRRAGAEQATAVDLQQQRHGRLSPRRRRSA